MKQKIIVAIFSKLIMLFSWTNLCSLMARPSFYERLWFDSTQRSDFKRYSAGTFWSYLMKFFVSKSSLYNQPNFFCTAVFSRSSTTSS